jgi:hypothetical protein
MNDSCCFDCVFFAPGGSQHNNLTEDQLDDCLEGECHRNCPTLGDMSTDRHGDEFRCFGEWPKVLAGDWCGRFRARQVDTGNRTVRMLRLTEKGAALANAAAGLPPRTSPQASRPASKADWRAWARRVADSGQVGPTRAPSPTVAT